MKKKLLYLMCIIFLTVFSQGALANEKNNWGEVVVDYDPTGTDENLDIDTGEKTISVKTAKGLAWIAKEANAPTTYGNFADYTITLANDMELAQEVDGISGLEWIPIGIYYKNRFKGVFDGNKKVITGLYINQDRNDQALFGATESAIIKQIVIENPMITGSGGCGALIGYAKETTIEECAVVGGRIDAYSRSGGLIGMIEGTSKLINCYTTCAVKSSISSSEGCGCLVGVMSTNSGGDKTEFENCYVTGEITGNDRIAPFIGGTMRNDNSDLSNCFYDTQTTGFEYGVKTYLNGNILVDVTEKIEGKTTKKMSDASTFAAWQLDTEGSPWTIKEGKSYPCFKWQTEETIPLIPQSPAPANYYTITLEVAPGIELYQLTPGDLTVEEGGHLHLQFLPEDRSATADNVLFLIDGVETEFKDFGSNRYFSYILSPVNEDHSILIAMKEYTITLPDIEGVTIDVGPGEHTVPYGDSFAFSLTLADGIDPADVRVYVNGTEIEAEPLRTATLNYKIDKVTGPVTIEIEGADDPVGNTRLSADNCRLSTANGALIIETTQPQTVQVYTVTGVLAAECKVNGRETIALQSGVYIVKTGTGVYKIVVR